MESPTTTGNTPEDRQKIVAEYREAKGDKAKVAVLVARYGVSGKQMNDWARRRGDPRGFSDELKREAVAYAKEHGARRAAEKFKVSDVTIYHWTKKLWATGGAAKKARNLGLKKRKGRGSNLGPPHPKEVKAEALRALAKGERPRDVAERLKLPDGTVSSWHWKQRHANPSGRRRKADPVALGNEALGIKPNGVTRRRGGRPDTKAVIKAIRDLRGQGTTIESVAVEGSTCTITFRVTETFEV